MRRELKYREDMVDLGITQAHRDVFKEPNGYPFTPDLYRLCKYQLQLLFVYDEWLSDRRQNFVLDDCGVRIATVFSQEKYNFLIKSTDQSSVAIPDSQGSLIKGELFAVYPESFVKLDKLRLNGLRSIRDRVQVIYPYHEEAFIKNSLDGYFTEDGYELPEALQGVKHYIGPEKVWLLDCFMYSGHPTYWTDMIHQQPFLFDRVPRFEPKKEKTWLSEYYKYQNP